MQGQELSPRRHSVTSSARESFGCVRQQCLFFFFSSRRRHTRFDCDWSSDVCSSDLNWSTSSSERSCSSTGGSRWMICADYSRELAWKIPRAAATTLRCIRDGESQDKIGRAHV